MIEPFDRRSLVPAALMLTVLLAVSARYGFHRDELYFIRSAAHPAWGYIDNPSITPAIGWLSRRLFGDSLFGLRVLPAVEASMLPIVVTAIARELGAVRRAQLLAAVLAASSGFFVAIGHLLTTPTFDVLVSSLVLLALCRMVRTGDQRWWLAIGAGIGVGLENKYTIALLVLALAIGAVATRTWRALIGGWLAGGIAIAALLWLPQLLWQFDHGWAQLDFARALAADQGAENRATLVPFQLVIIGPPLAPLLIAGVWALLRRPAWRPIRFLGVGYLVLLGLLLVTGGKGYYAAGMFGAIIAAGAIALDDWMTRTAGRTRAAVLGAGIAVNVVVGGIITLPILPQRFVDGPIAAINPDAAETIGWPSFVDQVAAVAATVPEARRARLVIFTGDYGEAGAVDRYGLARGLPRAYSCHNSYADFGIPPASEGPVLVIGYDHVEDDTDLFVGCHEVATVHTVDGIDNDVDGEALALCDGPAAPWVTLWPNLRHLG